VSPRIAALTTLVERPVVLSLDFLIDFVTDQLFGGPLVEF
jgi:hypothetical protein